MEIIKEVNICQIEMEKDQEKEVQDQVNQKVDGKEEIVMNNEETI
jgi:hypothetical protein